MTSQPCFRAWSTARYAFFCTAIGSRSALPMEPRSAFQPNGSALAPAAITQLAPPASATRVIAPMLPGSCTSAAMTTSGATEGRVLHRATTVVRQWPRRRSAAEPGSWHSHTEAEAAAIAVWRDRSGRRSREHQAAPARRQRRRFDALGYWPKARQKPGGRRPARADLEFFPRATSRHCVHERIATARDSLHPEEWKHSTVVRCAALGCGRVESWQRM